MTKVAILQSNYIPWKGYFDIINKVDKFIIYDEVQYTKNDWRNRNLIKTPNGTAWLTIPVRQKHLDQKISETIISQKNWNLKHWNTIKHNYSRSEYFKEYSPYLEDLYMNVNSQNLAEINLYFIKGINKLLNIDTEIIDSKELNLQGDKNERLIDAMQKVIGTTYLSGPSAKSYINEDLFAKSEIELEWMSYGNYPEYDQLHKPFEHGITILDVIFNMGSEAMDYITNSNSSQKTFPQ